MYIKFYIQEPLGLRLKIVRRKSPSASMANCPISILFLSALFIIPAAHSYGQDSSRYHLDAYMQAAWKTGFNGNVLVAKKGRIIYQQAFGFRNFDTRISLDNQSAFTMCSVSKQFTAMAIMLLSEAHKLTLNDTLRHYFPELPYQHITIANMLDHTSGLPEYQLLMVHNWDHNQIANNADLIKMLAAKRPPVFFKPGEKYRYSNTGYVLLASIIEKASGQSYQGFITDHIFKPLGMRSSAIYARPSDHPDSRIADCADGFMYSDSLKKYVPAVNVYPLVRYLAGIDGDDRYAHLPLERRRIDGDAFAPRDIPHRQGDDHRDAEVHDLGAEQEVALQVAGVRDDNDEVRAIGIIAVEEDFVRNLLVGAFGIQAVGPRKVQHPHPLFFGE